MANEQKSNFWSTAAPIIGSVLDFGTGLFGSLFNRNEAEKNRQFQREMYEQQFADNLRLWRMSNEYNLPSAQLNRLRDANLNPLLMYNNGASGVVATTPNGASAPSGSQASSAMQSNFNQAAMQSALIKAQIQNINADTEQKRATAENTSQSTQNLNIQWKFDKDTFHIRKLMEYGNYDKAIAEIRNLDNNIFNQNRLATGTLINLQYINENMVKRFNLDQTIAGRDFYVALENLKLTNEQNKIGWKNAASNWLNALSTAKVSNAQAGLLYTQQYQLKKMFPLLMRSQRLTNQSAQIANFRSALGIFSDIMNMNKIQTEIFRSNMENYYMREMGFGVGNGTLQQILAMPIVTFGNQLDKLFNTGLYKK